jgi:GTP cyclohydrolase II
VEPVWYLPGVAERFGCDEGTLRRCLFHETNGMYPELITRPDLKVFLPPIGGLTIYCFGDYNTIPNPDIELTVRVHDECNGSDVFGSDICTCRPYLVHGIEECVKTAQKGGAGLIIYYRKEGRALGEVTKYLVYNRRKRQEGGDTAAEYFNCTQHVAGVMDMRFQVRRAFRACAVAVDRSRFAFDPRFFSPGVDARCVALDGCHSNPPLGVHERHEVRCHHEICTQCSGVFVCCFPRDVLLMWFSQSHQGIEVLERIPIPPEMIPADAHVEIDAKVSKGYHGGAVHKVTEEELRVAKGRSYGEKGDPLKPGFIAATN